MAIGIVNDYSLIRFEIRFERKFPIRRSLVLSFEFYTSLCSRSDTMEECFSYFIFNASAWQFSLGFGELLRCRIVSFRHDIHCTI